MPSTSVLIVDDHPLVRDGLRAFLSAETDLLVIGEAEGGLEGVRLFQELRPDLVLMDLRMPDINGAEAIRRIREQSPSAAIIVLTSLEGDADVVCALAAGAQGFLFKDMLRGELVRAIRSVLAGQRYIPDRAGAKLAEAIPWTPLTPREIEVLQQIASGLRNKEIASELQISEETVKAHIKKVLEKLEVNDRTHAVIIGLKRGIIRL